MEVAVSARVRVVATLFKPAATVPEWSRNAYGPWYADKLALNVRRHHPDAEVAVVTDYPSCDFRERVEVIPFALPYRGWASLLEMFRPEVVSDDAALLVGLDTIFVSQFDSLIALARLYGFIAPLDPYDKPAITNAVVGVTAARAAGIWSLWLNERASAIADRSLHWNGSFSEMKWLRRVVPDAATFEQYAPREVLSYKAHVGNSPEHPADARIVYFHGLPKPHQLAYASVPWAVRNWGELPVGVGY